MITRRFLRRFTRRLVLDYTFFALYVGILAVVLLTGRTWLNAQIREQPEALRCVIAVPALQPGQQVVSVTILTKECVPDATQPKR